MNKPDRIFLSIASVMVFAFATFGIWQIFLPMARDAGLPEGGMAGMLGVATILLALIFHGRFFSEIEPKAPLFVQHEEDQQ